MHAYWLRSIFLAILVFVSLFFSFYQFGEVPPPYPWSDEASAGQDAVATLKGDFRLHYPDQGGGGNLWVYLATGAFLLLEPGILALRWLAGLAGVLGVVFFYAAAAELFRMMAPLRKAAWLAFLAALWMAVSTWYLIMSRVAWPPVACLLVVSGVTLFFWRGLRKRRWQDMVSLGIFIGLTPYLYVPCRFTGLVIVLFVIIEVGVSLVRRKPTLLWFSPQQILLIVGVALVVAAPMLVLYLVYPETFTTRIEQVSIQTTATSVFDQFVQNVNFYADSFGLTFNLARLPIEGLILGSLSSILLMAGILVAFWQISLPFSRYILIWWFLLMLPGLTAPTLEYEPSILRRAIGSLPVTFIFPVLAIYFFELKIRGWPAWSKSWPAVFLTPFVALTVIIFSALQTYDSFFVKWPQTPAVERLFNPVNVELVEWLERQSSAATAFVFPLRARSGSSSHPWMYTVRFLFGGQANFIPDYEPDVPVDLLQAVQAKKDVYLLTNQQTQADIKGQFPYLLARLGEVIETKEQFGFTIQHYALNRSQFDEPDRQLAADVTFGDVLQLSGIEIGAEVNGYQRLLWTELAWASLGAHNDYQVSLRLQDRAGHIITQQDKLLLNNFYHNPTSLWPSGVVEPDFYTLNIPPSILPGLYELHLLVYDARTLSVARPPDRGSTQSILLASVNIPMINGFPELKLTQPIAAQIGKSRVTVANFAEHIPENLALGQSVAIPCLLQFDDSVSQVTLQLSLASADQHWLLGDPKTVAIPGDWPTNAPFQVVLDGVVPRNIEIDDHGVLLLSITNRTDSAQIPLGRVGVQARPHLFDIPNPDRLVDAAVQFDEVALLRGYRLDLSQLGQENGQVSLDLYWQALAETDVAYKTFVHLLDAEGNIITQVDREPQAGAAPTTSWLENEIIIDQFVFPVDQALSNVARLVLGLYDPSTGIRAPIVTGPDDKREDSYYEITF